MLFHVSEDRSIEVFYPRQSALSAIPVVWAIDAEHLRNYLLPRDCPRVTFYAGPATTDADKQRFLGSSRAVVAIEQDWHDRLLSCRLYCYQLPPDTFRSHDEGAGYFTSAQPVRPTHVETIVDAVSELRRRGVELRIVPTLWTLRDAVLASSLQFSLIRMRNAQEQEA